ncbi:MAG: HD domain-containing protein [Candidatus Micrarchaeota archaeon]
MMIIKDNVYGTIEFSELEERIIDTEVFQRLRRIRQMSITNLVYPGANHTRFEHCIGTAHLTSVLAAKLVDDAKEREKIKLFGLLHDIGHVAFSHEGEDVLKPYLGDHEKIGRGLILKSAISDIINENYNAKDIADMAGDARGAIVEADIGADRMDYLKRDALNTGVAYGVIDIDRLVHTMRLSGKELCVTEGGMEAAEWLLIARFMMFSAVYLHKTVRIATAMVQRAMKYSLEDKTIEPKDFIWLGDDFALAKMRESKAAQPYVDGLLKRQLYKEVAQLPEKSMNLQQAKKLETQLSAKFNCDIIVDYPTQFSKSVELKVMQKNGKLQQLTELSDLVASLLEAEKHRRKILVLASAEAKEKYKQKIAKEII